MHGFKLSIQPLTMGREDPKYDSSTNTLWYYSDTEQGNLSIDVESDLYKALVLIAKKMEETAQDYRVVYDMKTKREGTESPDAIDVFVDKELRAILDRIDNWAKSIDWAYYIEDKSFRAYCVSRMQSIVFRGAEEILSRQLYGITMSGLDMMREGFDLD